MILLFLTNSVDTKVCFCEHKNGGIGKNGIICGFKGNPFQKEGYCEEDEFCTGVIETHQTTSYVSIDHKSKLCSKGIIMLDEQYFVIHINIVPITRVYQILISFFTDYMEKILGKWHLNGKDELVWNCQQESDTKLGCNFSGKLVQILLDGPNLTLEATGEIGVFNPSHIVIWDDGNKLIKQG